jgi:hypothetical protein
MNACPAVFQPTTALGINKASIFTVVTVEGELGVADFLS